MTVTSTGQRKQLVDIPSGASNTVSGGMWDCHLGLVDVEATWMTSGAAGTTQRVLGNPGFVNSEPSSGPILAVPLIEVMELYNRVI